MASVFVFDIDGTVLDSVGPHQTAFLQALRSFGFGDIDTDWDSYLHHTDSWIFRQMLLRHLDREPSSCDLDRLDLLIAEFFGELSSRRPAVTEGFREFVDEVLAEGHGIAFATGSMRRAALAKLTMAGIDLDVPLVTANDYFERERIVAEAARRATRTLSGGQADRSVCFGDGRWDLVATEALGFQFVGITAFSTKLVGLVPPEQLHPSFQSVRRAIWSPTSRPERRLVRTEPRRSPIGL